MPIENFILGPLYFLVVLFFVYALRPRLAKSDMERRLYMRAFLFKAGSVTFFALIYHYYYKGGDTTAYYFWAQQVLKQIFTDPEIVTRFLFTNDPQAFYSFKYGGTIIQDAWIMKYDSREVFLIKIASIVNLFGLNTYLSTAYLFCVVSFISNWLLYKVISYRYTENKKLILIATVFVPSVAFWGTSILKDTVTFSALCMVTYMLHRIFILKRGRLMAISVLMLSVWLIMKLKGYIILAFIPAAAVWILGEMKEKIKSNVIRKLSTPFLYAVGLVGAIILLNVIGSQLDRFSPEKLDDTITDFQRWHTVASADGSGYKLSVSGTGITDMIRVFPEAINVTFFRPYLWEAKTIVVFMAAVESLFFFLYFLYLFFIRGRIVYFLRAMRGDPIIQMCLLFSLILGFFVGFTSFNFGALARYKIPVMPYFSAFLTLCLIKINAMRNGNKEADKMN